MAESRRIHGSAPWMMIGFLLCGLVTRAAAEGVCVLQARIPANGWKSLALPFDPADGTVEALLEGQLTGGATPDKSDNVLRYDPIRQRYVRLWRPENGGWRAEEGDGAEGLRLGAGDGIWIVSRHAVGQTVVLVGLAVPKDRDAVPLYPGLNHLGYPYPESVPVGDSGLPQPRLSSGEEDGVILPWDLGPQDGDDVQLEAGRGYWYRHGHAGIAEWIARHPSRLSARIPDASGQVIAAVFYDARSDRVGLRITSAPLAETAAIHRWAEDGWKAVDTVERRPEEGMIWMELGTLEPGADGVSVHVLWMDPNAGMPAEGENLASGAAQALWGATSDGERDGEASARGFGQDGGGAGSDEDGEPSAAGQETMGAGTGPSRLARVWYVDAQQGDDVFVGLSPSRSHGDGPVRTIRAALVRAQRGDTVQVAGGTYRESIDLSGRDIGFVLNGNLVLTD